MEAGALGAEIVLSGKVTGARSRVEKFNRGYIKHNGEPAEDIVDHGVGTAVMKLGTIGVQVKIIPPNAELPDDFEIHEDVEVEDYVVEGDSVDDLLAGEPDEEGDEPEIGAPPADDETVEEVAEEEVVDEEVVEEAADYDEPDVPDEDEVEEELDDLDAAVEEELDEETEAEADELMDEMESGEDGDAE